MILVFRQGCALPKRRAFSGLPGDGGLCLILFGSHISGCKALSAFPKSLRTRWPKRAGGGASAAAWMHDVPHIMQAAGPLLVNDSVVFSGERNCYPWGGQGRLGAPGSTALPGSPGRAEGTALSLGIALCRACPNVATILNQTSCPPGNS